MLRPMFRKLSRACGLRCLHTESHTLFEQELKRLLSEYKYDKAVEYVCKFPDEVGRTPAIMSLFTTAMVKPGTRPAIVQYLGYMLSRGKLKMFESLELARMTTCRRKNQLMDYLIRTDKIECSEHVGDSLLLMDEQLAIKAYAKARVSEKVLKLMKAQKQYKLMFNYLKETGCEPNYNELLQSILTNDMEEPEDVVIGEEGPIAVLWDPRTCPLEGDKDSNVSNKILTALKERLNLTGPVVSFMAHGDAAGVDPSFLKSFKDSKAIWVDIPGEHDAVRLIGLEMMRFTRIYKPPACVVLISRNGKLASFFQCLKEWGYKTIIISDDSPSSLEGAAVYSMPWSNLISLSRKDFSEPLVHNPLDLVRKEGFLKLEDLPEQYERAYRSRPPILHSIADLSIYLDRYMPGGFVMTNTSLRAANSN